MAELTVVARIKAQPGKEVEMERVLRAAVAPTHEEPGCLRYALHRSTDDPATFLFVERWQSKAALDQHRETPHLKTLFGKLRELVAGPADVGIYELLPEGKPEKYRI